MKVKKIFFFFFFFKREKKIKLILLQIYNKISFKKLNDLF
jgi:hypothetical protein